MKNMKGRFSRHGSKPDNPNNGSLRLTIEEERILCIVAQIRLPEFACAGFFSVWAVGWYQKCDAITAPPFLFLNTEILQNYSTYYVVCNTSAEFLLFASIIYMFGIGCRSNVHK